MRSITLIVISSAALFLLSCSGKEEPAQNMPEETRSMQPDDIPTPELVSTESIDTSAQVDSVEEAPEVIATEESTTSEETVSYAPKIAIDQSVHQYGTIQQGDKVNHTFTLRNEGNAPFEIMSATASCGCTRPSYSFLPVAPGESTQVSVVFDSKGKKGVQESTVTVVTNAYPKTYYLKLRGKVEIPEETATPPKTDTSSTQ